MRARIAAALGFILFFVLAGTTVSSAFWSTFVDQNATVAVASLSSNCTPATRLQNGSFETPAIAAGSFSQSPAAEVVPWSTTDSTIEIWTSGYDGVASAVGNQFAELNSNINGTLFQDVSTTPGQVVRWSLLHRARVGTDVMSVALGAPGVTGVTQGSYSAATSGWVRHEGIYTVPVGQTVTKFAFSAVSTGSGDQSIGNFIDDVSFGSGPCLIASSTVTNITTPGGDLRVGDSIEYTTSVKNTGGSLALASAVAGVVPARIDVIPGSIVINGRARTDAAGDDQGEYSAANRTISARLGLGSSATAGGSIAPEEIVTLKFRATVTQGTAGVTLAYGASASYADFLAPLWGQSVTAVALTSTVALGADVSVATLATPAPVAGGPATSWTFTVTNNGPREAVGVSTTIILPASLSAATVTRTTGTGTTSAACSTTTMSTSRLCDIGALASGASRIITVTGSFPQNTPTSEVRVVANATSTVNTTVYDHVLSNNSATTTATVTAETVAPTAPTNVRTNTATAAQNTVTWTGSTDNVGVTLYQVFRDGVLAGSTAAGTLTYTDVGRTAGVAHVYSVRAGDAAGNFSPLSGYSGALTKLDSAQLFTVGFAVTGQCLTAAATTGSADLVITTCSASTLQNWRFVATSNGYYNVVSNDAPGRGWALRSDSTADGTEVWVSQSDGVTVDRAEWLAIPEVAANGSLKGTFTFVNRFSNDCLTVPGTANTPGTRLQQFTCNGSTSQSFTMTKKP